MTAVDFLALQATPGLAMIAAALAVPFIPHHARQVWMLAAIGISAAALGAGEGVHWTLPLMGQELVLHRADRLTLPFGVVFHLAAALNVVYGWHERRAMEHTAGLAYAGAAIAAVHAGDLISLFIFWEGTALASVFLLLAPARGRTDAAGDSARAAAMRYLMVQVASGVLLLGGAALYWGGTGSWFFGPMALGDAGSWPILAAFGIKAAFPLLGGWMTDAYPRASALGAVVLSAFTTKLAVYALARGFAGTEELVVVGSAMVVLSILYAAFENDLRRVLAYALANQLGFMVVAIGVGSDMAINGAVGHASASVLYFAVLFMAMGAVHHRIGTVGATELGGLYRSMPWTLAFAVVGAASIASVPLFSGFVAKSLTTSALAYDGRIWATLVLLAGSVGALMHAAIRPIYFTFFAADRGLEAKEAPFNMLAAMAAAAVACIAIGVLPSRFYAMLPTLSDYTPYKPGYLVGQLQLLVFAMLAFVFLVRAGLYPGDRRAILLDSDWLYRRLGPALARAPLALAMRSAAGALRLLVLLGAKAVDLVRAMARHPIAGPVIPGPAAVVQLALLALIVGVIYAVRT